LAIEGIAKWQPAKWPSGTAKRAPFLPIPPVAPKGRGHLETRDYNGPGEWDLESVQRRYLQHAKKLGIKGVSGLAPRELAEGGVRWVYPVMDAVITGIERGDAACIELGVEFVESDHKQPFGRLLHSNTARALRRATLAPEQAARLRARVLSMLVAGHVPHEFKQYAKLLRHIGLGQAWETAKAQVDQANPYVMKYARYFEACAVAESRRQ
jgi:hypothetical protein